MAQRLFRHPRIVPGAHLAPVTGIVADDDGTAIAVGDGADLREQLPGARVIDGHSDPTPA